MGEAQKQKIRIRFVLEGKPGGSLVPVGYEMQNMDLLYFALTLLMEDMRGNIVEYAAHLLMALSDGMPERLTDEIVQANADRRDDMCLFSGVP